MFEIYLSTTFYGTAETNLVDVLKMIQGLDIEGIELGSTHTYHPDIIQHITSWYKHKIVTHNFFPPTKDNSFVINIASDNSNIRKKSVAHAKYCIEFASDIGALVYTIHPGFMATPEVSKTCNGSYDFNFTDRVVTKEVASLNMLKSLKDLSSIARANNIKLAIETEGSLTKPNVLLMETIEEYDNLFSKFPEHIYLNLNLAHTRFASIGHGYEVNDFINRYYDKIIMVEISHNDGWQDQHLPLTKDSYIFNHDFQLPEVPHILEFRNSTIDQVEYSIDILRKHHYIRRINERN